VLNKRRIGEVTGQNGIARAGRVAGQRASDISHRKNTGKPCNSSQDVNMFDLHSSADSGSRIAARAGKDI
jgi:hypothetical protein